ncbi:MAG: DUF362 domain-containing protein [Calditrichales bacterium]|nr:MAG: DUF362 domain-containing protein [Calditrichales bacterium]
MKRRQFIKTSAYGALAAGVIPFAIQAQDPATIPDAVRVTNGEPKQLFDAAIAALGGMTRFISKGDVVVVKPNMGWDRAPEYAANTNPDLIAEIVKSCYAAGAKEVKVFDRTCNNPRRCYSNSNIEEKASDAGADVSQIRNNKFKMVKLSKGKELKEWAIYEDYLEADKVINVPIAKHHSLSRVTLGLKNLMGVMGDNRGSIHSGFDTKLADISSEILPNLTIIDGYRILTANGPSGGNLSDVKLTKTLIASSCIVTADFLGLDLFSLTLPEVGHLSEMVNRGMNKFDLNNLNLKEIKLNA